MQRTTLYFGIFLLFLSFQLGASEPLTGPVIENSPSVVSPKYWPRALNNRTVNCWSSPGRSRTSQGTIWTCAVTLSSLAGVSAGVFIVCFSGYFAPEFLDVTNPVSPVVTEMFSLPSPSYPSIDGVSGAQGRCTGDILIDPITNNLIVNYSDELLSGPNGGWNGKIGKFSNGGGGAPMGPWQTN